MGREKRPRSSGRDPKFLGHQLGHGGNTHIWVIWPATQMKSHICVFFGSSVGADMTQMIRKYTFFLDLGRTVGVALSSLAYKNDTSCATAVHAANLLRR